MYLSPLTDHRTSVENAAKLGGTFVVHMHKFGVADCNDLCHTVMPGKTELCTDELSISDFFGRFACVRQVHKGQHVAVSSHKGRSYRVVWG